MAVLLALNNKRLARDLAIIYKFSAHMQSTHKKAKDVFGE